MDFFLKLADDDVKIENPKAQQLFILSSTIISRWNFHLRKIFEGCWPSIIYEWKAIEVEFVSARICVLEPIVFVSECVLVFVVQFF